MSIDFVSMGTLFALLIHMSDFVEDLGEELASPDFTGAKARFTDFGIIFVEDPSAQLAVRFIEGVLHHSRKKRHTPRFL